MIFLISIDHICVYLIRALKMLLFFASEESIVEITKFLKLFDFVMILDSIRQHNLSKFIILMTFCQFSIFRTLKPLYLIFEIFQ